MGLFGNLFQVFPGNVMRVFQQAHDAPHVDDADNLIQVVPVQGKAGMGTLADVIQDLGQVIVDIDPDDFVTRHHDVLHRDLFQVEDAVQHFQVPGREHLAGFRQRGLQLFPRQAGLAPLVQFETQQCK